MDISTGWPKSDIHGNPAKTGLLQLIIFGREKLCSILYYDKKFFNWLRISCVVFKTTV